MQSGGPDLWSVSTGFAYQGADRWQMGVILDHRPTSEQEVSYCETLKILVDQMHDRAAFPPEGYCGQR